ncbi:hypothetical protein HBH69_211120 [Parastagonospora nodorum]|nr:hypothetical protein HBH49_235180 [Parastagonospora nodorum]KAH4228329.1 hypothetical protein HBI05_207290 [Parastagonospora nodorum]KAH5032510.1 hypothetical protein HBI74_084610 [Parastagonospora nodorum]KAH5140307.1 hypothetical protein HBH69_211120 [Parastagonospora nodorum]KAH5342003.1 hypothetical protein HBI48_227760 [Parastagonospora nodorum]
MDRHNDGPDNELSHLSRQGSNVDLLPGEDEHHEVRSSAPYPRFRGFLRQFRLGFLAIAFGRCLKWRSNNEYRKVAIHHSRTIAVTHGLLHLVPLGGAITILMLQWTSYLASLTRDDSTTLQFVAKLHELFMQASIVEIIFCLVLTQAIDGFVPLGLLSGTVQATQLAYIWSLDYLSIYKSSGFRGWRRAIFAISIPALILLISLVGPSSAILMIPKPGSSCDRNAVTKYTRDSTETMHPTLLDLSNGLSIDAASLNLTVDRSFDGQLEPSINAGSPTRRKSYLNRDSFMPTREPGSQKTAILISDRTLRLSSRWAYTYVEHQVQGETDRFYIED